MQEIDMVGETLSTDDWKQNTPHVAIEAAGQSIIVLPENFPLEGSELARQGNDLMIRSLDGVIVTIRGYFVTSNPPKLAEYGSPENTTSMADLFTTEAFPLDEELAQEELAQEALADETPENIAAFKTDAGISEEAQAGITSEFRVVDGDYTTASQSVPPAFAFSAPPPNDGTQPDLITVEAEAAPTPASIQAELAALPVTETRTPVTSQPQPEPAIAEAEPAAVPAAITPAPVPSEPQPEPVITEAEPAAVPAA
ncbi:MAG: hypothetical protein HQ513_13885, partial [Rhodospirillales bacterium]|nr:hypothetical protein [Rhodospirillales bacterium]